MIRSQWTPTVALADLPTGSATIWRSTAGHRLAMGRVASGDPFAIDDACPHEGYPLSQGEVIDCALTCIWHNFKFDVRSGRCLKGDEDVRHYPVRVVEGIVEVDLQDPDLSLQRRRGRERLHEALGRGRGGAAVREVVRLLSLEEEPEQLLGELAAHDAAHGEWSPGHSLAVAADALRLLPRLEGPQRALAIAQPIDLLVRDHAYRPARPRPEPVAVATDPEAVLSDLRQAVEAEQAERAEAIARGAIQRFGWQQVLPWLSRLCGDHLLSFGHRLIYAIKTEDLLAATGGAHADLLIGRLVTGISWATREEQVPAWAPWRRNLESLDLDRLWQLARPSGPQPRLSRALVQEVLDGRRCSEQEALAAALEQGAPIHDLIRALMAAAAHRLLRMDPSIDADPTVQDGWLDATHRLTYAVALRDAWVRHPHRDLLPALFHSAHWIARSRPLEARNPPTVEPRPAGCAEVLAAIRAGDAEAALAAGAGLLRSDRSGEQLRLRHAVEALATTDAWPAPIVAAHVLKTSIAAYDAAEDLPEPERQLPILAVLRMAASPIRQRFIARQVHDAIGLVTEGRVPRTLS